MKNKNMLFLIVAFIIVMVIIFIVSNSSRAPDSKAPFLLQREEGVGFQTQPEGKAETRSLSEEEKQEPPIPAGELLLN